MVQNFGLVVQNEYLCTTFETCFNNRISMKGLKIVKRTSKAEGAIRLRFRLRDGRSVDLYHKSEIDADLKDLDKFADTGELKPRVSVYNKKLKLDIDTEIDAMESAYKQLCEQKDKTRITTDEFEKAITMILHPQKSVKALTEMTLIDRFSKYIDDGLRDGNFGEGRQRHYKVSLGELTRFLTIQHRLKVTPSEFDADDITDYWKSRACLTPEGKAALTPENLLFLTPVKS